MTVLRARLPASLVVFSIALLVLAAVSRLQPAGANNYVFMADAWLHGVANVPASTGAYIDAIPWRGREELVEAPLPGILMLPMVELFGTDANQTILSIVLGAAGIGAAWLFTERMGTTLAQRIALVAFLTFGTSSFGAP